MSGNRSQNSGCLLAILSIFGGKRGAQTESLPYRIEDEFLSKAEISFHGTLASVVKEQAIICSKVRLADVFSVTKTERRLHYFNRISAKHVDFLLCDAKAMKPLAGVELDDSSHSRSDREERDEFVDKVFQAAGLPLVHVKAQREYNPRDLAAQILPHLSKPPVPATVTPAPTVGQPSASPANNASKTAPSCPKCGIPMLLRTAKSGSKAGQNFYGCPNYPKCRETTPVE